MHPSLHLRKGFLTACIAILLTGTAAFYGGRAWERDKAAAVAVSLVKTELARQEAFALQVSRSAVKKLQEGRSREAESELVRFAWLQSTAIEVCLADEKCRSADISRLPTATEVAEVKSWIEALTPPKPAR